MKKHIAILIFCCCAATIVRAQDSSVKTDTVMKGFYILPDSNCSSFTVTIQFVAGVVVDRSVVGNQLPPEVILMIIMQEVGTRITYHETTAQLKNNVGRPPSRQYVIGERNTVDAVDARGETILITAKKLAEIRLDSTVLAFAVSVTQEKQTTQFGVNGNTIPEERKSFIRALRPGQKVYFEMILIDDGNGKTHRVPLQTYIIME